jgi:hypothetical protein
VKLTQSQRQRLFHGSLEAKKSTGHAISQSDFWLHNVQRKWFYELARDVAGSIHLSDQAVMELFFGAEGWAMIQAVVRSEYWFWVVVHEFSQCLEDVAPLAAVQSAIAAVRANKTWMAIDRLAALENRMSEFQLCQFTGLGVILVDNVGQTWEFNPLWFHPSELALVAPAGKRSEKAAIVRSLIAKHPDWKDDRIAQEADASRYFVLKVRADPDFQSAAVPQSDQ